VCLCSAQLIILATLAQSIIIAGYIGKTFGVSHSGELSWFAAAFSLTSGTFILPAGRLGDWFGHKRIIMTAWVLYSIATMTAGLTSYTKSVLFFDICRAVQGLACAFMIPSSLAILGTTYHDAGKKKNFVFAIFAACAPNGFLVSSVISASLAEHLSWEWAFYIPAMLTAVLVILGYFFIPEQPIFYRYKHFDYWGSITGVIALILFNLAWNEGPIVGWSTPYVYILLTLGVVFFILFVGIEIYIAKEPLIPPSIFNLDSSIILLCVAFGWATFGIWIWFIVQFLQVARHTSPLWSVAMLFPSSITGTLASFVAGFLVRKIHASWLMVISMTAFCIGTVLVATQPIDQTYWAQTFISVLIMPFGMDMNMTGAMITLSNSIPVEHQGMIFSLINMFVNYSVSIGLGIAGTVAVYSIPNETDVKFYRYAWYTGIGLSGIGILISTLWICVVKSRHQPSTATRTASIKKIVSEFTLEENIDINYHDVLRLSAH